MSNTQSLERTMLIYKNFKIIANFVKDRATKQEAIALLEALSPLNEALRKKLDLPEGAQVKINWGNDNG